MNAPRGRPFQAGNTLGQGRPRGSRNKTESPEQQLLREYTLPLMRKCVALRLGGNSQAMRLCMALIGPAPHGAFLRMKLPPIRTAQDVDKAAEKVTQAICRSNITTAQGATMIDTLKRRLDIQETVDVVRRIEKLEEGMVAQGK
jgi:hypothetical protein